MIAKPPITSLISTSGPSVTLPVPCSGRTVLALVEGCSRRPKPGDDRPFGLALAAPGADLRVVRCYFGLRKSGAGLLVVGDQHHELRHGSSFGST